MIFRTALYLALASAVSMCAAAPAMARPNAHPPITQPLDPMHGLTRPGAPRSHDGAHHNDGGSGLQAAGIEPQPRFCNQSEKAAYLARVQAIQEQAFREVELDGAYRAALAQRAVELGHQLYALRHAGSPGPADPNRVAELAHAIDVVELEITAYEPVYQRAADYFHFLITLDNAVMAAPIVDCTAGAGATSIAPVAGDSDFVAPAWPQQPFANVPGKFCSEQDRSKWLKDVLDPLKDKSEAAVSAWSRYADALSRRRGAGTEYSERLEYAARGLTLAKQYSDSVQLLYDQARSVVIRDCAPKFHLGIGLGIGIGGGHAGRPRPENGSPDQYHGEEGRPPGDNQFDGDRPPVSPR